MGREDLSRREFLEAVARWSAVLGGAGILLSSPGLQHILEIEGLDPRSQDILRDLIKGAPTARYWTSTVQKGAVCSACHMPAELKGTGKHQHKAPVVKCLLCAHECLIQDGERGRCRARYNLDGELKSLVYGRPITEHVDPIEKKPFYHFLPGTEAYSLATSGCPLRCKFCQNWEISQASPEDYSVTYCPADAMAKRAKERPAPTVAFTYNEPTVFTEYLTDIARAARKLGIKSVLISCGFMNEAPLAEMIGVLDAIKIDLKGFSPDFMDALMAYEWPGNVRELVNTLDRTISLARNEPILFAKHLPVRIRAKVARFAVSSVKGKSKSHSASHQNVMNQNDTRPEELQTYKDFRKSLVDKAEKEYLGDLVALAKGNLREACRISGLGRTQLYMLLKKHDISRLGW